MPNFYWVNLGFSHKEVLSYNFLWAPKQSIKNDRVYVNAGWKTVPYVKRGDVIFCNEKSNIIYVAVARSDAYISPRPENRAYSEWNGDGSKIDVELTILDHKVESNSFKDEFIYLFNDECTPKVFTSNGSGTQTYMCHIPESAGAFLLDLVGDSSIKVQDLIFAEAAANNYKGLEGKNREVIAQARIGQGQYRKDILKLWGNKCAITGISNTSLLTASHIHSWHLSTPREKRDPYNGFPLCPTYDRLFDLGLISFKDDGKIIFSPKLDQDTIQILGLHADIRIKDIKPENTYYLEKHRMVYGYSSLKEDE